MCFFVSNPHLPCPSRVQSRISSAFPYVTDTVPTHLSSEVLQNGSTVHCSCGTDPSMARGSSLQMSVDAAHWKLEERPTGWAALERCHSTAE